MDSALSYLLYYLGHSPAFEEFCPKPVLTTSYLDLKKTDTTDQEHNPRCCNSEQSLHWRDLRGEEKSAAALPTTSCTV